MTFYLFFFFFTLWRQQIPHSQTEQGIAQGFTFPRTSQLADTESMTFPHLQLQSNVKK